MQFIDELRRQAFQRPPWPYPFVVPSPLRWRTEPEFVVADAILGPLLPCGAEIASAQRHEERKSARVPVLLKCPAVRPLQMGPAKFPEPPAAQVALESILLGIVGNLTTSAKKSRPIRE